MVKRYLNWFQISEQKVNLPKNAFTALGMLAGVAFGGALGIVLFGITGQAMYIAITGVFAGIGLSLGAGIDQHRNHP